MSQFTAPAETRDEHAEVFFLHLVGVESLDQYPPKEMPTAQPAVNAVNDIVDELTENREITIVYEIPALQKVDDLQRAFRNVYNYLNEASALYLDDEFKPLANTLQNVYAAYIQVKGGTPYKIQFHITNNIFGLRVALTIESPDGTLFDSADVFVINPDLY